MESFLPLMPMLVFLPPSVAIAWIAHRWLRTREGGAELRAAVEELQHEVQQLRAGQLESQERLDFAERLLRQLRDPARPALPEP